MQLQKSVWVWSAASSCSTRSLRVTRHREAALCTHLGRQSKVWVHIPRRSLATRRLAARRELHVQRQREVVQQDTRRQQHRLEVERSARLRGAHLLHAVNRQPRRPLRPRPRGPATATPRATPRRAGAPRSSSLPTAAALATRRLELSVRGGQNDPGQTAYALTPPVMTVRRITPSAPPTPPPSRPTPGSRQSSPDGTPAAAACGRWAAAGACCSARPARAAGRTYSRRSWCEEAPRCVAGSPGRWPHIAQRSVHRPSREQSHRMSRGSLPPPRRRQREGR